MAESEVLDYETCGEWLERGKGILDGAKTLDECAKRAERFAKHFLQMKKDGWKLVEPVEGDYARFERKLEWLRAHPEEAKKIKAKIEEERGL